MGTKNHGSCQFLRARKGARKTASKRVAGEKGGWAARKGRMFIGIAKYLPGT